MNSTTRTIVLASVGLSGLVAFNAWAFVKLAGARAAAAEELARTNDCRQLIDELRLLRRQPALAGAQAMASDELAHQIERAAGAASIPTDAILRVSPESPRRLTTDSGGESSFQETPTQVQLRPVTLPQLATFLYLLTGEGSGLHVTAIRLTAPHEVDSGGMWSADLTLSYWMYAPKSGPRHGEGKGDLS